MADKIGKTPRLLRRYDFIGSMNQAASPFMMPDQDVLYMRNMTQNEFGALQKDGGYTTFGTMQAGTGVASSLFTYIKNDGTQTLLAFTGTALQKPDATVGTFNWSNISTSASLTTNPRPGWANYLDRAYYAIASERIRYTDGSTVTNADSESYNTIGGSTTQFDITNPSGTTFRYTWDGTGTDPLIDTDHLYVNLSVTLAAQNFNAANNGTFVVTAVGANYFEVTNASGVAESNKTIGTGSITLRHSPSGRYLATMGNVLYMAGLGTYHTRNQVIYTKPGTTQFFSDGRTYTTTDRIITVDGSITGLYAFRGLLYIFTTAGLWYHNPANLETKILFEHGTTSHFTIKELMGNLLWVDRAGVWKFDGSSLPVNIVRKLQNKQINSAWYSITGGRFESLMSAEVLNDKYYLSVGDLAATLPGDSGALTGVVFVFDLARESWSMLDTHPAYSWARIVDSNGADQLLFSSTAGRVVYRRNFGYVHNTTAITGVVRTQYYHMDYPELEKVFYKLFVMVRPQNQSAKYITVKVAINGSNSYQTVVDSSTSNKIVLSGATTLTHVAKRVDLKNPNNRGHNISYEFSNADSGINFGILGFTQEYAVMAYNKNISTT